MLDGITVETPNYVPHGSIIFEKSESMFDTDKKSLYYVDCCFDVIITYRNPRNTSEIKKIRVHRNVTQIENFMWSQLDFPNIEILERERLLEFLAMQPALIYWDLVLGMYHSADWDKIRQKLGNLETLDERIIATKLYLVNYRWKGMLLKFYRINPENNYKYSRGLLGLTKAEIVCPIFYVKPETKQEAFLDVLKALQTLRRTIMEPCWKDMQFDIAKKLIARDPWIHPWSGNDADLQGIMLLGEKELTEREKMTPEKYLETVNNAIKEAGGEKLE